MNKMKALTGLFLGAGASYEAAMPLAAELTDELTNWLTPEKLRWLNQTWNSQDGGYPDHVIDDFTSVLDRPDQNYESLLGHLEVQSSRHSQFSQEYHGLHSWLVEIVYYMLYYRHVKNIEFIKLSLEYYDGIASLTNENHPLWVFSLNHDLIVDCLAARMSIPISWGFSNEEVTIPRRDGQGEIIGHLRGLVLSGHDLRSNGMQFFRNGTHGINLLQIHGSLDTFTFRDGKDLLKFLPLGADVNGPLHALRSANEELLYQPHFPAKVNNGIVYADEEGEMQFLRRTLLAGAFKFSTRHTQVLPRRILDYFQTHVNSVTNLVCIGYGFGDNHINRVIREWLDFSHERRLIIVDPARSSIPSALLHVASQVELQPSTTTEYLDVRGSISRSKKEVTERKTRMWLRGRVTRR